MKYSRLRKTSIHANINSSTKLVLQSNEIQPAQGNIDSSTKLVLQSNEQSSRLTKTSIPVLSLYYKAMKNQLAHLSLYYKAMKNRPAHGNLDSSTKLVLQSNE